MSDNMSAKIAIVCLVVAFFGGILFLAAINYTNGANYHISTPITNLDQGQVYTVEAVYRSETNCFLLLKPDGETSIKYYNLTSTSVPIEVAVGNRIARLSSGIAIVP